MFLHDKLRMEQTLLFLKLCVGTRLAHLKLVEFTIFTSFYAAVFIKQL